MQFFRKCNSISVARSIKPIVPFLWLPEGSADNYDNVHTFITHSLPRLIYHFYIYIFRFQAL